MFFWKLKMFRNTFVIIFMHIHFFFRFALVFFLSKKLEPTNDEPQNQPPVPQRVDSLTSVASNPPDVVSEP